MSIKGNLGQAVLDIGAVGVDTVLLDFDNRVAVTALSLYNTTGANADIEVYYSPDTTSASGKLIASQSIAAGEAWLPTEVIGQGFPVNENVIVVDTTGGAVAGNVNAKMTYINYTGSS
jgi:hypothetical protein